MIVTTYEVNSIIHPTLKGWIGAQANVNGAKAFLAENNKGRSYSGGNLAMAMLIEALTYTQSIVAFDLAQYMKNLYSDDVLNAVLNASIFDISRVVEWTVQTFVSFVFSLGFLVLSTRWLRAIDAMKRIRPCKGSYRLNGCGTPLGW